MRYSRMAFAMLAGCFWSQIACAESFSQQGAGANDQAAICWGKHDEPLQLQAEKCTESLNHGNWPPTDALLILLHRASVYRRMGQVDHEMADFDLAVAVAPRIGPTSVGRAYNARCFARAISGEQLDQALSDCNAALAVRPEDADYLDSRCFVYYRMNNYAAAIGDCSAAIKNNPKESASLYVRGLAERRAGDAASGNADIAAAEAIDPKVADTYAGYGVKP